MTAAASDSLADRVALVFGGSSGIGAAVARRFAQKGARVAVVASGSLSKAQKVVEEIIHEGGHAMAFVCDVRDCMSVRATVAFIETKLGPIDILVNSAGVFYPTPLGNTDADNFDRMVDINFKGTWLCIDAVAPGMVARKRGNIVNVASVAGISGLATYSAYCATKAAVIMMTKAMSRELAPHGINVNAIAPGNTATPMNESVRADADSTVRDRMLEKTPSGILFSSAEEIADAVYFLVSPAARPMHGSVLVIDEGISTGL